MDPDPIKHSPRRIVGLAGLLRALRTLGLLGPMAAGDRAPAHFTADDGQPIPVWTLGRGVPVVLVHGLGCSHEHWMAVGRRLSARAQVWAWDARCHGACPPRGASSITLQRLAGDLKQILEHFAIERAVLVGHSMGALTVLQYLQDHGPDRVMAVGLVDQSPRVVTDADWRLGMFGGCSVEMLGGTIAAARRDLTGAIVRELEAVAGDWLRHRPGAQAALGRWVRRWLGDFDAAPLLDLAESLARADFRALLPTLDMPLWVVLGARSPHYGNVPLADYYRRTVPHATVSVFEHSGHSPHVAEPGRFARELQRFLDDHA